MPVCVEGIEDEATHASVLSFGCEIGQGWYFGKPMEAEQASELLAQSEPAPIRDREAKAG